MSKKAKEQVKFNADLTEKQRYTKLKLALKGEKSVLVITIIYGVFFLFMLGIVIGGSIFDTIDMLEGGSGSISLFCSTAIFMLYFFFAINTIFPTSKTEKNASSKVDGCFSEYKTLLVMPIDKKALISDNFKHFLVVDIISTAIVIMLNVFALVIRDFSTAKAMTGYYSIMISLLCYAFYLVLFSKFTDNKIKKHSSKILTVLIIIFYILWLGSTIKITKFIDDIKFFEVISGYFSIAFSIISFVAVILTHKFYILKKAQNRSWDDE